MKKVSLVFFCFVATHLLGCRTNSEGNQSEILSVSYAPHSPRLVGVVIDPNGTASEKLPDNYRDILAQKAVICGYEWRPGMNGNEKVLPLNKNGKGYSPAKAQQNIFWEFKTAWAGTLFMGGVCAFIKPCHSAAGLIATTLVAVMGAQRDLGQNEARQNGWPMLTDQLDARWSEGQYLELKEVIKDSGNTDTTCVPVEARVLHKLEMEACANQTWTCPAKQ